MTHSSLFGSMSLIAALLSLALGAPCAEELPRKYIGSWKSDEDLTLRDMNKYPITEKAREIFEDNFFGRLILVFRESEAGSYFPGEQELEFSPYEVISVSDSCVETRVFEELLDDWMYHTWCIDGDLLYTRTSKWNFKEYFRRIEQCHLTSRCNGRITVGSLRAAIYYQPLLTNLVRAAELGVERLMMERNAILLVQQFGGLILKELEVYVAEGAVRENAKRICSQVMAKWDSLRTDCSREPASNNEEVFWFALYKLDYLCEPEKTKMEDGTLAIKHPVFVAEMSEGVKVAINCLKQGHSLPPGYKSLRPPQW